MRLLPQKQFFLLSVSRAAQVTREEVIATTHCYPRVEWMPENQHVRHGLDSQGFGVRTPDLAVAKQGDRRGWWQPENFTFLGS